MKTFLLAVMVLGLYTNIHAQATTDETRLRSLFKADLGIEGIGLTYEPRISNRFAIDVSAGTGGGYDIGEEGHFGYYWYFANPAFYFSLTPKYFYNRKKRLDKGKKLHFNSGNYIGLKLKYATPNSGQIFQLTRNSILVNAHWGIQRAMGNHFLFTMHLGAGYAQDIDYNFGTIYPAMDIKFSYIIASSKK